MYKRESNSSSCMLDVFDEYTSFRSILVCWFNFLYHIETVRSNYHFVIWKGWNKVDCMADSNGLCNFWFSDPIKSLPANSQEIGPVVSNHQTNTHTIWFCKHSYINIHHNPSFRRWSPFLRPQRVTPFGNNRFKKMLQNHIDNHINISSYFLHNAVRVYLAFSISNCIPGLLDMVVASSSLDAAR